jgi:hypothetical protein
MAPVGGFVPTGVSGGSGESRFSLRRMRMEQVRALLHGVLVPLAERRDVVQDPEGAAVGGHDEIVAVNHQIADGGDGQIILQWMPGRAVVKGHEDADFGAGEEQAFAHGIFADCVDVSVFRQARDDFFPGLAGIVRAVDVRMEVVHLMAVNCGVGCGRVVAGSFDEADLAPVLDAGRRDVRPMQARIECQLDEAIICAGPDFAGACRRWGDRVDDAARLATDPAWFWRSVCWCRVC